MLLSRVGAELGVEWRNKEKSAGRFGSQALPYDVKLGPVRHASIVHSWAYLHFSLIQSPILSQLIREDRGASQSFRLDSTRRPEVWVAVRLEGLKQAAVEAKALDIVPVTTRAGAAVTSSGRTASHSPAPPTLLLPPPAKLAIIPAPVSAPVLAPIPAPVPAPTPTLAKKKPPALQELVVAPGWDQVAFRRWTPPICSSEPDLLSRISAGGFGDVDLGDLEDLLPST